MRTPQALPALSLLVVGLITGLSTACGPDTQATINGTVDGRKLNPVSYYWGGPFLVFTTLEAECIDMGWVERGPNFDDDTEAPVDVDSVTLLFTFDDPKVTKTNASLEGDAIVDARVLVVEEGDLTVHVARTGTLVVEEVEDEGLALGSFDVGFDEGSLTGDFEIEWCTNLKSKF